MNYKYRKSYTTMFIILWSISTIFIFLNGFWSQILKVQMLGLILSPIVLVFSIKTQIRVDKMYNVYIDDDVLVAKVNKGWVSEQTIMQLTDITIIRSYTEHIIIKKVEICTRYKCIRLNIRNFKNYKEMLQLIVDRTEKNKRIKIDDTIYTMMK